MKHELKTRTILILDVLKAFDIQILITLYECSDSFFSCNDESFISSKILLKNLCKKILGGGSFFGKKWRNKLT